MFTSSDFLTVAGASGITAAVMVMIKALWPPANSPWITWAVAEGVTFIGGLVLNPASVTGPHVILLFTRGMVVAAAAIGGRTSVGQVIDKVRKGGKR